MDNGVPLSLFNPAIATVLATTFLVLWSHHRHRRYPLALAVGYAFSGLGFCLQQFTLPAGLPVTRLLSNVFFIAAALLIAGAIISRFDRRPPVLALGVLAGSGLAAFAWFMFVTPDLSWRILSMNFALGGICLVVAAELHAIKLKGSVEKALLALALLSAVNFVGRTLLALYLHGPFSSYEGFGQSFYWTSAVLSHAVLSMAIALLLVGAAMLDVMGELRAESLTDPLSGLLNRRGFEFKAGALLRACAAAKLPVALIVADLDRFKELNDRHGHAAGDRVIAEFAARLRMAAGTRGIGGRLGGEEFAVLLPMADLEAARLLAEAVRRIFSQEPIPGLPAEARVTASFGVAARSGDEGLETLFLRADEALYRTKKNGRNSVRISFQRPVMMPERGSAGLEFGASIT